VYIDLQFLPLCQDETREIAASRSTKEAQDDEKELHEKSGNCISLSTHTLPFLLPPSSRRSSCRRLVTSLSLLLVLEVVDELLDERSLVLAARVDRLSSVLVRGGKG
jgi:hypothetical protein